jgi:hypothetical protein
MVHAPLLPSGALPGHPENVCIHSFTGLQIHL